MKNLLLPHASVYLSFACICMLAACASDDAPENSSKSPNILFILADDHTCQALSCYGGIFAEYAQTQHIDQLADEGMRFDYCYNTNAICSPSRATILTGKYSHRNGVYCLGQPFDSTQATFATLLQQQGYHTAVYGKWHLATTPVGFDDYKVLEVQGRYQDPQFREKGVDTLVTHSGWSTDIIADMTIEFLRNQTQEKPFLAMCHFKGTHDPWASRPPYDTLFSDIDLPEPDNLLDTYEDRSEAARRTTLKLEMMNQSTYPHDRLENVDDMTQRRHIYQQYIKDFLRCGRVVDENVGRIMEALKASGFADNTIVIYTTDQGHFLGEHGFFSKRFMYEEAMRMPLIIRYPGIVQPGTLNSDFVVNTDFAPTLLDMAGVAIPESIQGRSIMPLLRGETPDDWRDAVYYHYWQHILHRDVAAHYGIRTRSHKLIFYYGLPLGFTQFDPTPPEWELFDLEVDPSEMHNVYGDSSYTTKIQELKQQLLDVKQELGDTDDTYPELQAVQEQYYF